MIYERTANGYRCRTHDVEFGPVDSCPNGPDCGDVTPVTPVTIDKELELLESEMLTEARHYRKRARELTEGTGMELNAGIKAADLSLKFDRARMELVLARKTREHEVWLVEQDRLRRGDGVK